MLFILMIFTNFLNPTLDASPLNRENEKPSIVGDFYFMEVYKNLSLENLTCWYEGEFYTEEWKDIKGHDGVYQISSFGRVKILLHYVVRLGGLLKKPEKIMKLGITSKGYLSATIYKNKTSENYKVATLVWDYFGSIPRNGFKLQVDHKDEIKINNFIGNLRLLTPRDNLSRNFVNSKYLLGVRFTNGLFNARIYYNGKRHSLGYFKTEIEAHNVYLKATKCV